MFDTKKISRKILRGGVKLF